MCAYKVEGVSVVSVSQPPAIISNPLRALAMFLFTIAQPTAFNPCGPGIQVPNRLSCLDRGCLIRLSEQAEGTVDLSRLLWRPPLNALDPWVKDFIQEALAEEDPAMAVTTPADLALLLRPFLSHAGLAKSDSEVENLCRNLFTDAAEEVTYIVPKVLFVLGGPGAGKTEQCKRIEQVFHEWAHIGTGDLKRAERERLLPFWKSDTMFKDLDDETIKTCMHLPPESIVNLLWNAMDEKMYEGKSCFVIDGFPRDEKSHSAWVTNVSPEDAQVLGVLLLEVDDAVREKRILKRGEDRDGIKAIAKRFARFWTQTMPVVDGYNDAGKLYVIDASGTANEVWSHTFKFMQRLVKDHRSVFA